VEAILFDWDGTLVDSLGAFHRANETVMEAFGLPFDVVRYRQQYVPDWREMYRRLGVPHHRLDEANGLWEATFAANGDEVAAFPGAVEAVAGRAAGGIVLGIVTAGVRAVVEPQLERETALAAVLFVLPVAVHGFSHWSAAGTHDASALTPGLVDFLRRDVPKRDVVYADLQTSYRISAYAPVYVANGPPSHVADTRANDPYGRVAALHRFLRDGDTAILRRYHAQWLVLRRGEWQRGVGTLVYRDARFRVYRLPT
jgi:hypothetical protein